MTEMPQNRIEDVPAKPTEGAGFLANIRDKVSSSALFLTLSAGSAALATAGCEEGKPPVTQESEAVTRTVRRPEVTESRIAGVVANADNITTVIVVPKTQRAAIDLAVDFHDKRKGGDGSQVMDFSLATGVMGEGGSFMKDGQMNPEVSLEIIDAGSTYTLVVDTPNKVDHVRTNGDAEVYVSLFVNGEQTDYVGPVVVECEGGNPDDDLLVDVPEPPPEN